MQVGLVGYYGLALGIAIGDLTPSPISLGVTSGILKGKCNSLHDYLGDFFSIQLAGQQKSLGTTKKTFLPDSKLTGCNSDQTVKGLTTELMGSSLTKYVKLSEFVTVKGPRIKKLLDMMSAANADSRLRKSYNISERTFLNSIKATLSEFLSMGFEVQLKNKIPQDLRQYNAKKYIENSIY